MQKSTHIWRNLGVYGIISLGVAILSYHMFDIPITEYLTQNRSPRSLAIWECITQIGHAKYAFSIIVLGFLWSFFTPNIYFKSRIQFAVYATLWASFVLHILKYSLGRMRPKKWFESGDYGFMPFPPLDNTYDYASMPSGHTQAIFTVATVLCIFFPRYRMIFLSIATVVGFSRVMVGAHWFGDVVMGACVGIVIPIAYYHIKKSKPV